MTDRPIPPGSILLHVGPQKTGSTAIQSALQARQDDLRAEGVLYPGRPFEPGWVVMGEGAPVGAVAPQPGAWDAFAEAIRSTTLPRVCVSNEDLARADDAAVGRIAADLGAERIHLVYVARRLDRLLPSQWQQRVKARMRLSWHEYLRKVLDPHDTSWESRLVWSPQDVAAVVGRWLRHVPAHRITVVTADDGDRRVLPRFFETALALPDGLLTPPRHSGANRSLSYPEVELLRHVNGVFVDREFDRVAYRRIVQRALVPRLVGAAPPPDAPAIPGLPSWALDAVADRCDAQADALVALGVNVVGDPQTLRVRGRLVPDDDPPLVESVSMDLFVEATDALLTGSIGAQEPRSPGVSLDDVRGPDLARAVARRLARRARASVRR